MHTGTYIDLRFENGKSDQPQTTLDISPKFPPCLWKNLSFVAPHCSFKPLSLM